MANKRIINQDTDTALSAGDYVIVDSQSEGTRKFDLGTEITAIKEDFKCPAIVSTRNISNGTIALSLGDMASFVPSYTASAKITGFKALAINTDGNISSLRS